MIYTCEKCGKVMRDAMEAIGHKCCIVIIVTPIDHPQCGLVYGAKSEGLESGALAHNRSDAIVKLIVNNSKHFNIEIR